MADEGPNSTAAASPRGLALASKGNASFEDLQEIILPGGVQVSGVEGEDVFVDASSPSPDIVSSPALPQFTISENSEASSTIGKARGFDAFKLKADLDESNEAADYVKDERERCFLEAEFKKIEAEALKDKLTPDKFTERSLFVFHKDSVVRSKFMQIMFSPRFDQTTNALILLNCVCLALYDPNGNQDDITNVISTQSETVFTVLFSGEVIIKVVAMGFVMDKYSYCRDGWNMMDLFVVLLGWAVYLPGVGNFLALRTIRLIRPLRTIGGNPGLRLYAVALLDSVPLLIDVFLLWGFVYVIFGITAMSLWSGKFHYHCVPNDEKTIVVDDLNTVCGQSSCPQGYFCTNRDYKGGLLPNPNFGGSNFDNFGWSFVAIFQTLTMEGWVELKQFTSNAWSEWAVFYWVLLILFGSFFVVNLATAVVFASFTRMASKEEEMRKKREQLQHLQDKVRASMHRFAHIGLGSGVEELELVRLASVSGPAGRSWACEACIGLGAGVEELELKRNFKYVGHAAHIGALITLAKFKNGSAEAVVPLTPFEALCARFSSALHLHTIQRACFHCAESAWLQNSVLFVILLNSVTLAIWHDGISRNLEDTLRICNLIFTIFFAFECVLKLCAYGVRGYLKSRENQFDFVVVITSLLELAISWNNSSESSGIEGISVLRSFRLLRMLRLFESWESLKDLLSMVQNSMAAIGNFSIILVVVLFTFSLLGMQLFGDSLCETYECSDPAMGIEQLCVGQYSPDGANSVELVDREWRCLEKSPANYSNLYWAALSTFQCFTAENFFVIMFQAVAATSGWAVAYFVLQLFCGHYILMNLFLAGIVQNVVDTQEKEVSAKKEAQEAKAGGKVVKDVQADGDGDTWMDKAGDHISQWVVGASLSIHNLFDEADEKKAKGDPADCTDAVAYQWPDAFSLFLFSPAHSFRKACLFVVSHSQFENVVTVCIMVSSLALCLENPNRDQGATMEVSLRALDYFFTAIFTLEMLMKVVAFGLAYPQKVGLGTAYLRNGWNKLDFVIVVISIVSLVLDTEALKAFKAMRTLRALRPLRLLTHNDGMRQTVATLLNVIPAVLNLIVLFLLGNLVFAILGVQLFAGKMGYCTDSDREYKEGYAPDGMVPEDVECVGSSWEGGQWVQREWRVDRPHFDNTWEAFIVLFEIASMEDWNEAMYKGIAADSVGSWLLKRRARSLDRSCKHSEHVVQGLGPAEAQPLQALYFLAYVVVGSLFVANLLVSTVVNEYLKRRDNEDFGLLTKEQQEWLAQTKEIMETRPERLPAPPARNTNSIFGKFRYVLFRQIIKPRFDIFIMCVIFLNIAMMMFAHYDQSEEFTFGLNVINGAFALFFLMEAAAKITAFGFYQYWMDGWNKFDFVIVLLSIFTFVIERMGASIGFNPTLVRVFRVFRTARVLRVIRTAKGLRMLLRTFIFSLPSLWNVGSLLFLVMFVYSILGMYLLGGCPQGEVIDQDTNFETFTNAIFVLLRSCTGENWNSIFHAYLEEGYYVATPFFTTYLLIVSFVMLNLFIAVILENFAQASSMEDSLLSSVDYAKFTDLWGQFDPDATQLIKAQHVPQLLMKIDPPLGMKGLNSLEVLHSMKEMNLVDHGEEGNVHFYELLSARSFHVMGSNLPKGLEKKVRIGTQSAFPTLLTLQPAAVPVVAHFAAMKLQAAARGRTPENPPGGTPEGDLAAPGDSKEL
ncbi:hypothetical protein CYMTET_47370 [Cymbomonas tetramitiformis]|uniref:Uncharacterized protein n=1 Tax=Cymbomonas tetramitiformis TaxID=36881 RepID=A0AAE0BUC1_9CHLO|nr:hypothetical protein CYMTET_47370 [Cymbomonas tetramitiformis]